MFGFVRNKDFEVLRAEVAGVRGSISTLARNLDNVTGKDAQWERAQNRTLVAYGERLTALESPKPKRKYTKSKTLKETAKAIHAATKLATKKKGK